MERETLGRPVGEEPPFHMPMFVLTHHAREPLVKTGTTFTFVTEGIEPVLQQAQEAAGGKDIALAGGANVAQQYLRAGQDQRRRGPHAEPEEPRTPLHPPNGSSTQVGRP